MSRANVCLPQTGLCRDHAPNDLAAQTEELNADGCENETLIRIILVFTAVVRVRSLGKNEMRYAALFLALSALPAVAAEPQYSAPANWSGFYIGGHGGAGWGSHDATILPDIFVLPAGSLVQASVDGLQGAGK